MATLLENISAQLDAALADDAALDAAAAAADSSREEQINALKNLKAAVAQVPEGLLVKAVQNHLTQVKETVINEAPVTVPISAEPAVDAVMEAVIEQVAGDSEEITEIPQPEEPPIVG